MLHNELPKYLTPVKLCRHAPIEGTTIRGEIKVSDLTNLSKELRLGNDSTVSVSLKFSMDNESLCAVKGELSADLKVTCQRCLQPMVYPLRATFRVSPVSSDAQAERLGAQYEPLWVPTGEINVAEWIAEEIHLALPLAPCHEPPCVSFGSDEELDDKNG